MPGAVLLSHVPLAEAVARTGLAADALAARGVVPDADGRCDLRVLAVVPDDEPNLFECTVLGTGTL